MNWGFDYDKTSNFSHDKAKHCENGDCDNCEQCDEYNRGLLDAMEDEYWHKGYKDGEAATRTLGGTRGAEWNADQKNLKHSIRGAYIAGFNQAIDDGEAK